MARTDLALKKVLIKLHRLLEVGADFTMTRWIFDWDDSLAPVKNINAAHNEKRVLQRLKNRGVVKLRIEDLSDAIPEKSFNKEIDYKVSDTIYSPPSVDSARTRLLWAVWITGFDYEKYDTICKSIGFDPSSNGSPAELSFTGISTPTVTLDNTVYTLNSMSDGGMPFNIVSYGLSKPGELVRRDELKQQKGLATVTNVNQALKRSYFDHNNGLLRYFVKSTAGSIKVSPSVVLSDSAKLQLIKKAKEN